MYYFYDEKTLKYLGSSLEKPLNDKYTEVEPSDAEMEDVWYLRIYQPETDTWRDWDPHAYEQWLDSQKPTQDQMTQAQMMFSIAQLTKQVKEQGVLIEKQNKIIDELKGDKDVSND